MKTTTRAVAVLPFAAVLALAGCQTDIRNQAFQGSHAGVAASFQDQGRHYAELGQRDHYRVCNAFAKLRRFDSFFDCHKRLEAKVAAEEGRLDDPGHFYQTMNVAWSTVTLQSLKAQTLLQVGDDKAARLEAEQAQAIVDSKILRWGKDQDRGVETAGSAIANIFSLGGQQQFEEATTVEMSIPLLGVLAITAARAGDTAAHATYVQRLAALDTTGYITGGFDGQRRYWLAQAYFEVGDYEQAYRNVSAEAEASTGNFLREAITKINLLNPAFYLVIPAVTGTANLDELAFAYEFEPRFLLHLSELETGRLEAAARGFDAILAEPRVAGYGAVLYGALHGRGRVALAQGDRAGAADYFRRAIEVIEEQRSSINTERYRIGFVADKQAVYLDLVRTLVEAGRPGEAFDYAERGKARALVDLLASKRSFGGAADKARIEAMLQDLDRQEQLRATPTAGGNGSRAAGEAQARIRAADPELATLTSVSTLSARDIQARLGTDEALVEYFGHGGSDLFAFVVAGGKVEAVRLDADGLRTDIANFRDALADRDSQQWDRFSSLLYDRLIAPLPASATGARRLTIVPHGALHYLPFNALSRDGHFLIERQSVRLLPSASVLGFLDKPLKPEHEILLFGNPDLGNPDYDLPGAEAEAAEITRHWPGARVALRRQASESLLKTAGGNFRYLHLASHGKFDPDAPLASRLLLAPDAANDGNLTVSEIYDLSLNADMVTLSACQTGLGDVKDGDDVVGLTRGFLYAGARSIVASLWEVPDEPTRLLMTTFYDALKTTDRRDALRQAQIATLKRYRHPAAWAAFQLVGAG